MINLRLTKLDAAKLSLAITIAIAQEGSIVELDTDENGNQFIEGLVVVKKIDRGLVKAFRRLRGKLTHARIVEQAAKAEEKP